MFTLDLEGKVAIVFGSTSGLGEAIAREFADNGMKVVVTGRRVEKGEAVVKSIQEAGGIAAYKQCDVTDPEMIRAAIDFTVETFGGLNVVVNNSGVGNGSKPIHELPLEDYDRVVNTNLRSVVVGMKYGIEAMLKCKAKDATVINVASGAALEATAGLDMYTASKHAVAGITKSVALAYAPYGITVNAICPGTFKTEIFANTPEEQLKVYERMCPNGRMGDPKEVGWLAAFLASDKAREINGALIPIDAGKVAGDFIPVKWAHPEILD